MYIILTVSPLYSQGFDWQYSSRMPTSSPTLFVGVSPIINSSSDNGNINFFELNTPCTIFENGTGAGYGIGIKAEYWFSGLSAIYGNIFYSSTNHQFKKLDFQPRIIDTLITEYKLESNLYAIGLEFGVKHRLLNTHLHVGASLAITYLTDNSNNYTENVIAPIDFPWQSRTIYNGKLSDFNRLSLTPGITLGYDFNLGLGMYATPTASINFPLTSLTGDSEWRDWKFSFGISVMRGIK